MSVNFVITQVALILNKGNWISSPNQDEQEKAFHFRVRIVSANATPWRWFRIDNEMWDIQQYTVWQPESSQHNTTNEWSETEEKSGRFPKNDYLFNLCIHQFIYVHGKRCGWNGVRETFDSFKQPPPHSICHWVERVCLLDALIKHSRAMWKQREEEAAGHIKIPLSTHP